MAITSTAPLRICMTSCLVLKFSMAILTTMIEISSTGLRICAPHSKHVCIVGLADWFVIFQELLCSIRHFCEGPGFYNNFRVIIFDSIYESFSTPFAPLHRSFSVVSLFFRYHYRMVLLTLYILKFLILLL